MSDFYLSKEARENFRAKQFKKDINDKEIKQIYLRNDKRLKLLKRYKDEESKDSNNNQENFILQVRFI
jgi:hypothetical protein